VARAGLHVKNLDKMPVAASRESTSPTGTTSSAGSKRKRGTESKFYSVRIGHKPGIYLNWQECLDQIKGFKGATCGSPTAVYTTYCRAGIRLTLPSFTVKSFGSLIDAEKFLGGDDPTQNPDSSTYQPKFYGVRNGRVPGVYTDWPSAQKQIIGWTKPKHKCFSSRAEAEAYVANNDVNGSANPGMKPKPKTEETAGLTGGGRDMVKEVGRASKKQKISDPAISSMLGEAKAQFIEPVDSSSEGGHSTVDIEVGPDAVETKIDPQRRTKMKPTQTKGGVLRIYTDGSSLGNGKYGASAGVGVYFGEDDSR
jgi:ribonuclease HI